MKRSQLFTKTRREDPKDEVAKNAKLLIRAGFIYKEMAGAYALLPLGLRVVEKIKQIVREEMNALGGQEMVMTSLQRPELWQKTDRWSDENVDVWFKSNLRAGGEVGFGWSHEEPITEMMTNHIGSYRDLPVYVYQFQTKLRNELRAKSGIMRGREFVMKDMYSYSKDKTEHEKFYQAVMDGYMRVFNRLGIGDITYITYASGGSFTKEFSHEFQTLLESGEDTVYLHRGKNLAVNEEMMTDEALATLGLKKEEMEKMAAAEVGNIFSFGTGKCEQLGLYFNNESGEKTPVYLGSYGIGITRLVGVLAEKFADDKGLVWPEAVAPFQVGLVSLGSDEKVLATAEQLYNQLLTAGIEVLFDDRDVSAGEKLGDVDLLGLPYSIIIGNNFKDSGQVELINRQTGDKSQLTPEAVLSQLKK